MRSRPVRPNIYLPVVRFGVADSDWFSVLLISCAGYLAPVPFGITVFYVPLQMWTWLLATAGSIGFFNYIRIGRKPFWLQHKLKSVLLHHRQYRSIPNGRKRVFHRTWLLDTDTGRQVLDSYRSPPAETANRIEILLELNSRIQEAREDQWNAPLLTTNERMIEI
ncbi:MAG TPA: hypothetical protein VN920_09270 [Pyrinomonadaceae bacterium]|nr:hypothetical protein [Pyrinomonadaceae bacterium]